MYRILEQESEVRERRNQLRHPVYEKPKLLATTPNQVSSWDITKLLGPGKWTYYHLFYSTDIRCHLPLPPVLCLAHCEPRHLTGRLQPLSFSANCLTSRTRSFLIPYQLISHKRIG